MGSEVNSDDPSFALLNEVFIPASSQTLPAQTIVDTQGASTIKKSEDEHKNDPTTVPIPPPWISPTEYQDFLMKGGDIFALKIGNVDSVALAMQTQYNDICSNIVDKWVTSLQEMADQRKIEENSPMQRSLEDYQDRIKKGDPAATDGASSIISMAVMSVAMIGTIAGAAVIPPTSDIGLNVIIEGLNKVMAFAGDLGAEFGLLGVMFGMSTMYQAAVLTIAKGGANKDGDIDENYARNYAQQVLKEISGTQFNNFLQAVVIRNVAGSENLDEKRRAQLGALVKLVLLFNAMALMTKTEVKHLTMEELAAMVTGDIKFDDKDPRSQIVSQIHEQLSLLDPDEKMKILDSLLAYYNNDPPVEKLADPVHAFYAMFDNTTNNSKVTQQAA